MLIVVAVVGFFSWLLRRMGAPWGYVQGLVGVVALMIVLVHLTLPIGNPLREALGGTLMPWGILAGLAAVIGLYIWLLNTIRSKSRADYEAANPTDEGPFSPTELDRYARHLVLREIGGHGQQRLKQARVLVIGAGGLGSPVLQYLAAAGVGTLGFIDDDLVSLSNLQRQVLFNEDDLDKPKVFAAEQRLERLNPHVAYRPYNRSLTEDIASDLFEDYDVIIDGTDDFATRALVNRTCVALGKPLISGAISQWEGQVTVVHSPQTACMHCLFPKEPEPGTAPSCAEGGVLGALPGVVGSMMAVEAVKLITFAGEALKGRMLIYDALYAETRIIETVRRAGCEVCGGR
ncbi:MAG: HesA/MoeB/ThiF family protein [Pseudomonadota bacterium]